jgi:hypothetical protein
VARRVVDLGRCRVFRGKPGASDRSYVAGTRQASTRKKSSAIDSISVPQASAHASGVKRCVSRDLVRQGAIRRSGADGQLSYRQTRGSEVGVKMGRRRDFLCSE